MPTPRNTNRYEFRHWENEAGLIVDPSQVVVTEDTKFTAVFEYIAPQSYTVSYVAGKNGTLVGQTAESVVEGDKPTKVPTPKPDADFQFTHWVDEDGKEVNPADTAITRNRTFTAQFEYVAKTYTLDIWECSPRTTNATNANRTVNPVTIQEGETLSEDMFTRTTSGPVFDANGRYISSFDKPHYRDTWYQRIDDTEQLTTLNYYYRKTFYAGRGGALNRNGSLVYAYSAQTSLWGSGGSITAPTPVADNGWHFSHWVNMATG